MALELYRKKGGRTSKPSISITTAGQIGLNKACFEKHLGDKNFAQLYADKDKGIIGVKAVDKEGENTFKITRSGNRASGSVAARSFLNYLEIDYSKRKKIIPEWDEKTGMLIIKLE